MNFSHWLRLEESRTSKQGGAVLDHLRLRGLRWFADNCHPNTGLVLDRSDNWGKDRRPSMASIAATGYYLSVLYELVRTGVYRQDRAEEEARKVMQFCLDKAEHHEGIFYHFIDWETGKRWRKSEASVLDTAIFLNGCMVSAQAFPGCDELADRLIRRANWKAYQKGELLSLGWSPEEGYFDAKADVCSTEMLMPYVLAVGSGSIDSKSWDATKVNWGKNSVRYCQHGGRRILNPDHPLFTSNIGLGWMDLKGKKDRRDVDLDENARQTALANRSCWDTEDGWWGISACDGPSGYQAHGLQDKPDGTVAPLAALMTLPWIADEIKADLEDWRKSKWWDKALGVYGLSSFNVEKNWVDDDIIGIDVGGFLLAEASHRMGCPRQLWMTHPVATKGLRVLGFVTR